MYFSGATGRQALEAGCSGESHRSLTPGAAESVRFGKNCHTAEVKQMDNRQTEKRLAWMRSWAKKQARQYGSIGINDADDIAQNAMIYLLRNPNCLELGRGWISKVVRSTALDAFRCSTRAKRIPLQPKIEHGDLRVEDSCNFEQHYCASTEEVLDLRMDLQKALANLQKPLLTALWLFSQGYSCKEIGVITNTNSSTVRTRIYYGRRAAQKLVVQAGIATK